MRNLRRFIVAVVLAGSFQGVGIFSSTAHAALFGEVEQAKSELSRQIEICGILDSYIENYLKPRLKIIRESSELTLASIEKNGLGNTTTMNLFQMQIITYQYSELFIESLKSSATEDLVQELSAIATKIKADRGGPYLKITNHIFSNMEKHFRELKSLAENDPLAKKLDNMNLWAELGDVIASSAGGDSPSGPNCKAITLYRKIKTLYPDFYAASAASPIFDSCQSIIGLLELYNEYAKADEARCFE